MEITLETITEDMSQDQTPSGYDGCSNFDRITFVRQVLNMPALDLNLHYDFSLVLGNRDAQAVEAVKHLLMLKMDYMRRGYEAHLLDYDLFRASYSRYLIELQRIRWHLAHIEQGVITPPFPAFHF